MVVVAVGGLVVLVAALFIIWAFLIHPWREMPDEPRESIEERWNLVEEMATYDPVCAADATLLVKATVPLETCSEELGSLVFPEDDEPVPRRLVSELPECAAGSVETLVAWDEAGGGLGMPRCGYGGVMAVGIFRLGMIALSVAEDDPEDPGVLAVLQMARQARQCGALIYTMVGFALAREAARWAIDRGVSPGEPFHELRPLAEEVVPALAREPTCTLPIWEKEGLGGSFLPWYLMLGVPRDREFLIYKKYHADKILEASKHAGDLDRVARIMTMNPADIPANNTVILFTGEVYGSQVRKMDAILEEYDSFLAGR
jgi:hypothetical protein